MSTTPGTVTPRDTDPDITRPAPDRRPPASAWALLRPLVLRLHFYAGVLVAPFLTVAALTGIVYVFSPQLSDLVYSDELLVGPRYGAPRPLDQQVAVAVLVATALGLLSLIFCGYRMWWHTPSLYNPANFFGNPHNVFGNVASFNIAVLAAREHDDDQGLTRDRVAAGGVSVAARTADGEVNGTTLRPGRL